VTGEVPDPADYIAGAAICVNPVQVGAGMQNKLIEFMAMEKAVVASMVANEGIPVTPGDHLVITHHAEETANALFSSIVDPNLREAPAYILEHWRREAHFLKPQADMIAAFKDSVKSVNAVSSRDGG
jgi:hypothetical protein